MAGLGLGPGSSSGCVGGGICPIDTLNEAAGSDWCNLSGDLAAQSIPGPSPANFELCYEGSYQPFLSPELESSSSPTDTLSGWWRLKYPAAGQ